MSQMIFEDRTGESTESALNREALGAGMMIARTAFAMCKGDGEMTVRVLAAALGTAIARSGATIEDVLRAVEEQRDAATVAFAEQERILPRRADA